MLFLAIAYKAIVSNQFWSRGFLQGAGISWPFLESAWVVLMEVNVKNYGQLKYVLEQLSREHPTYEKWGKTEKLILYLTTDFITIRMDIYE